MNNKKNLSIEIFNVKMLMVEEDFGYLGFVKGDLSLLPLETSAPGFSPRLKTSVDSFLSAFGEFDDALKASAALPSVAVAAKNDQLRDAAWSAMYAYVKGSLYHPNAEIAGIASDALKLFSKYGNALHMNQAKESGILENLIPDLHAMGNEKLTKAGLKPYLDDLEQKQKAFQESVKARSAEEGDRLLGIVKEKRAAADEAYRDLICSVNSLVHLHGDEHYKTFVKSANAIIKRQEEQVELRRTMAKKKREKDPKLPKEPKPNTPKPDDKPDIKHPEEGPKKPDPKKPEEGGGKKPEGGGTGGDPDIRLPEE